MESNTGPTDLQVRIEVLLDAISLGGKKNPRRAEVRSGQVFVLSHGLGTYDQDGFPEVYLAGEVVSAPGRGKAEPAQVVVLADFPGTIDHIVKRVLPGISASDNDFAVASFLLPICTADPIQTLRHTKGRWGSSEDRGVVNMEVEQYIKRCTEDLLNDPIQVWSGQKDAVLDFAFAAMDRRLQLWGLRLCPNGISLIRHYPASLDPIALDFRQAELEIADAMAEDRQGEIEAATGFTVDELTHLAGLHQQQDIPIGASIVSVVVDKRLASAVGLRDRLVDWLKKGGKAAAADFVNRLYGGMFTPAEIALGEQVLLARMRNPMLSLGEYLNPRR